MPLSKQQREPHPQLAKVRAKLERLGVSRREASQRCESFTDAQCDSVLTAADDAAASKAAGIDPEVAQKLAKEKFAKATEKLVGAGFVAVIAGHLTDAERDAVLAATTDQGVGLVVSASPDPQIKALLETAATKAAAKSERSASSTK